MQISFKNDIAALTKDLQAIKQSAVPKATQQSINKTLTGSRTDAQRQLTSITGIPAREIVPTKKSGKKSPLFVRYASKGNLQGFIDASKGRARNLINFVAEFKREPNIFNARKTLKSGRKGKYQSKGVKAKAWRKSKVYQGTFIGKAKNSGAYLVFARKGSGRKPLKSITGPSIREEFSKAPFQAKLKSQASVRFRKNMAAAVRNQIRLATKNKVQPR